MLSKEQISTFKARLEEQKKDLENRYEVNDHFGLLAGHYHESMGELSSYDNHPADEGTDLFEREKDIAGVLHLIQIKNDCKPTQAYIFLSNFSYK